MAANQNQVVEVANAVRPAVVQILTRRAAYDSYLHPFPTGVGSGVSFDGRGHILTNYHVIADSQAPRVIFPDGRHYRAAVVGGDPRSDLAVLRVEGWELPLARLGDSARLQIGETVVAIGNALGLEGGPTITVGVVSAKGRSIRGPGGLALHGLLQTDAAINPGNSGGPLVNLKGEVVGINTAMIAFAQGVGFAIAINMARPIVESLLAGERVARPWLGVTLATVTPALAAQYELGRSQGVVVVQVEEDGPAYAAGVRPGDVIIGLDSSPVATVGDLGREVAGHQVGERVHLQVVRDGQELSLPIILRETPGY